MEEHKGILQAAEQKNQEVKDRIHQLEVESGPIKVLSACLSHTLEVVKREHYRAESIRCWLCCAKR